MGATGAFPEGPASVGVAPAEPGGLLDVLGVAAVVLDSAGRIALWSPQAEELFGWTADQALGRFAAPLLVAPEHFDLVLHLFAQVMSSGETWAGVFPVRHKDGSTRLVEFRNMRLLGEQGQPFALGIATDQATLREVERDLALSVQLVAQSPIGLAVLDTNLRYVMVNPALEGLNGLPAAQHIGSDVHHVLRFLDDTEAVASMMRQVLDTGRPLINHFIVGRSPTDPGDEIARSVSYYRLENPAGRVLGVAASVVDSTEQHRAGLEAAAARKRLATIARASAMVGTTLMSKEPPGSWPTSWCPSWPTWPPSTSSTQSSTTGNQKLCPPERRPCSGRWQSPLPIPPTPSTRPTRPGTSPPTPPTGSSPSV